MAGLPQEKVTPMKQRQDLEVIISGKLDHCDIVGEKKDIYRNVIITPAKDEYSFPSRFCVMSRTKIGDKGGSVTVHIRPVELLNLKEGDIDIKSGLFFIPHPKEKQPKLVPIIETDIQILSNFPRGTIGDALHIITFLRLPFVYVTHVVCPQIENRCSRRTSSCDCQGHRAKKNL